MKKFRFLSFLLVCASFIGARSQQLAFPGAEGFGKYATGGRSGSVYHVTNLDDSGPGSFRDAVSTGNRIVVFDVGGVIKISSAIAVDTNIYIAGQTAPGEGITIYGNRLTFTGANNAICRYIRIRMGAIGTSGKDACGIANGSNMIFDHVSVSWGRDENFSINWDQKGPEPNNITIQNSIISQGLLVHSAGGLIQTNGGVTLYRNLYVDNSTRNNKVKGANQYVNNIVYNWGDAAYIMGGDSEGSSYTNVESNYFIAGPSSGGAPISGGNADFHLYAVDNWVDKSLDSTLNGYEIPKEEYTGGPDFQSTPYNYPALPAISAQQLYDELIPSVGASLPYRDYADYYVINEVKSLGKKGELISDESNLPFGAPSSWSLWTGNHRNDRDGDGMPDEWEDANGTNKAADDAMVIASNGYANIENYINGITETSSQKFLRTPLNFTAQSSSINSITFNWMDYTKDEEGFILERYINGTFVPVDTVEADATFFVLAGLEPEETDTFRLYAYSSSMRSECTDSLVAKSKPLIPVTIDPDSYVPDIIWSGWVNNIWDKKTLNWRKGFKPVAFTDSSKVLFGDAFWGHQSVSVEDNVIIKAMLVKSRRSVTFSGRGNIAGKGSLNKTGKGELTLSNLNTYKGQTVIWDGTVNINKLANGGYPSSIGASSNYGFNLIFKGGKLNYTGESVSTDRSMVLDNTGELSVDSTTTTVTMAGGTLTGPGGFIKSGAGNLLLYNNAGNTYEGETSIKEGILLIDMNALTDLTNVIGTSGVVNLTGGTLNTVNGQVSNYEVYDFTVNVPKHKTGGFIPFRNCSIKCKVNGAGILNYTIPYVREYILGDWSEFTGTLNAIGAGNTSEGSQLLLDNGMGLPKTRVYTSGNTKIVCWKNASTMYLGGLSGDAGTYLAGADKKNKAATMTWVVGGANTNETFNGIINDECSSGAYKGKTSIVKEGRGIWRLTGANVYSGTTNVTGGTLIINGIHSSAGKLTVQNNARLAGVGTIGGAVEILSQALIEPGDFGVGRLKINKLNLDSGSIVNIDIDAYSDTCDQIAVTDTVFLNGTLRLKINGRLTAGDEFTIFTGAGFKGSFDKIKPLIPGKGLKWEFSNGILKVVITKAYEAVIPTVNDESNISVSVKTMPNPVENVCNVNISGSYNQLEVKVLSSLGTVLYSTECNTCSMLGIDFSSWPAGVYYLNITADGKQLEVKKVVKK